MTWPKVSPESQAGPLLIDGEERERYDPTKPETCMSATFDEPKCPGAVRVVAGPYSHFDGFGHVTWEYVKECDTCHEAHVEERGEHWSTTKLLNDPEGRTTPVLRTYGYHPLYEVPIVGFVIHAGQRIMQQTIYVYNKETFMLEIKSILHRIEKGFEALERDHPEWRTEGPVGENSAKK